MELKKNSLKRMVPLLNLLGYAINMNTFSTFLTEDKNTHLEHLEDDILNNGLAGAKNALWFLGSLMTMLQSNVRSSMNVTVKWDGAPAVFAGTNPDNGKFLLALSLSLIKNRR